MAHVPKYDHDRPEYYFDDPMVPDMSEEVLHADL